MPSVRACVTGAALLALSFLAASCGSGSSGAGAAALPPASLILVSGNAQTGVVGTELPAPVVAMVTDSSGRPVPGQLINFRVAVGGGSVFAGSAVSDSNGTAQELWTLGTIAGPQRLEARAVDARTGAPVVFASFDATAVAGAAASVVATSGGGQQAIAASALPAPLVARVADAYGNAVPGAQVEFVVTAGQGTVSPPSSQTDSTGSATATWTLGPQPGTQTAEARVAGLRAAVFSATASVSGPASLSLVLGADQAGVVGTELALPIVVKLTDSSGRPLSSQAVTFEVTAGGGTPVLAIVSTVADGTAQVSWRLGNTVAPQQLQVRASDPDTGLPITSITVNALALPGPAAAVSVASGGAQSAQQLTPLPFPVRAWVVDAYGNSVPRVQVSFTADAGSGSATPSLVTTNDFGIAESTWTLGASLGAQILRARVAGLEPAAFSATATVGPPQQRLALVSGGNQTGVVGATLASPIAVRVVDLEGAAVIGQSVDFRIMSGGGSLTAGSLVTDTDGAANVVWQLGTAAGARQALQITTVDPISGLTVGPLNVVAVAVPGPPVSGLIGPDGDPAAFPVTVFVIVADVYGNIIPGLQVSYLPGAGCGSVAPTTSFIDGTGLSRTTWTTGSFAGVQTVQATVEGLPEPLTFTLTTTIRQIVAGSYQGVQTTTPDTAGDSTHCPNGPLSLTIVGERLLLHQNLPGGGVGPDGLATFTADSLTTYNGAFVVDLLGNATGSGTVTFVGQANGWANCSGTWNVIRQ